MSPRGDNERVKLEVGFWRNVRERDLYSNPLWRTVCELVHWTPGNESFEQAQLRAIRDMPRGLRYYFLIMRFDALWGNGGMESVVLTDDPEGACQLVEATAEALRFHGSDERAGVLEELARVTRVVEPELRAALDRDAPASELRPLYDRITAFDERYDKADRSVNVYARIVRHAHAYPEEYVPRKRSEAQRRAR